MKRPAKRLNGIKDERGLSLIEILIAVSIMSIISVTIMGYFVTATERSADESRRIIASNLARQKTAELRELGKKKDLHATKSNYRLLFESISASATERIFDEAHPFPAPFDTHAIYKDLLKSQTINGTAYAYRVELEKDASSGTRRAELNARMGGSGADDFLLRMKVTVLWKEDASTPSSAESTTVDSYLVEAGG